MIEPRFPMLTREVFDSLILVVIAVGLILGAWRFYQDMTRPLPSNPFEDDDSASLEQTKPHHDLPQ